MVLRAMTDEIMYELMKLSGQEYVDEYAPRGKSRLPSLRLGHHSPSDDSPVEDGDSPPEDGDFAPGDSATGADSAPLNGAAGVDAGALNGAAGVATTPDPAPSEPTTPTSPTTPTDPAP